jgi:hypothetical protein
MIVNVTRDDLRDEFAMADEAFALSPISARAAQPSEQDYDAIREAFMETSRGRWFLGEYAKRNRNADTRMVLDAVARIEEALAAQKQPPSDNGLAEAMAAIREAVGEARAAASAALGGIALEENLAPVRKGARVIREIAWRLREIGADGRICDLIDSQVSTIEAACEEAAETDPGSSISAAFDLIEARMATFDDRDASAPPPAEQATAPSPPAAEEVPSSARASEEAVASPSSDDPDAAPDGVVETVQAAVIAIQAGDAISSAAIPAEPIAATAEAADMISESADLSAEAAEAHDDAVLELIAHEMAALDPADADDPLDDETYQIEAAELPPAAPVIAAETEPQIAAPEIQPSPQPSGEPAIEPSIEPSLGSSLIANGIVARPRAPRPDPLAPIRRMSQTEKIALFS